MRGEGSTHSRRSNSSASFLACTTRSPSSTALLLDRSSTAVRSTATSWWVRPAEVTASRRAASRASTLGFMDIKAPMTGGTVVRYLLSIWGKERRYGSSNCESIRERDGDDDGDGGLIRSKSDTSPERGARSCVAQHIFQSQAAVFLGSLR